MSLLVRSLLWVAAYCAGCNGRGCGWCAPYRSALEWLQYEEGV